MCGVTSWTISPTVRNSRRSTPCVLGCCGPMLTSISSVRTSNSTTRASSNCRLMVYPPNSSTPDFVIFQGHFVVFSQRMPDPILGTEDATKVGMAEKANSHQIVGFPLVPIGDAPHAGNRVDLGKLAGLPVFPTRELYFEGHFVFELEARQVVDDFNVRFVAELGCLFGVWLKIVDAGKIIEMIHPQPCVVPQEGANFDDGRGGDFDPRIDRRHVGTDDFCGAKLLHKQIVNFRGIHGVYPTVCGARRGGDAGGNSDNISAGVTFFRETARTQSRSPRFQTYAKPTSNTPKKTRISTRLKTAS